jgi:CBS domain-containing protein
MTTDPKREFLAKAKAGPVDILISDLLRLWNRPIRDWESVGTVNQALRQAGLGCEPSLLKAAHGATVRVGVGLGSDEDSAATSGDPDDQPLRLPLNPIRVRDIPSAKRKVERVTPEHNLAQVQGWMMENDCSLLAVMSSDRDLVGAVSWELISSTQVHKSDAELDDVMLSPAPEARSGDELLERIGFIEKHGFFYVRGEDDRICGLVTATDLTTAYRNLTTPYFQLGEIERRLRRCIGEHFTGDELCAACPKNKPNSADEMTFGDYLTLLGDNARWTRMGWGVDHVYFMAQLDRARTVRNKIMHFGAELSLAQQEQLQKFLNYMRRLDGYR